MSLPPLVTMGDEFASIRSTIESLTDSNPYYWPDFHTYSTVRAWYLDSGKKEVIDEVLKRRIKVEAPQCLKAVLLLQIVDLSVLASIIKELQKVVDEKYPMYSEIAELLLKAGKEAKASAEEEISTAHRGIWTDLYGQSRREWPGPLKEEPAWGNWAMFYIPSEMWWGKLPES